MLGDHFEFLVISKVVNRHRRKRPKVDASIFDSVLSHTRRSDASKKREENSVSSFGRFRLCTSFESSPVSVKSTGIAKLILGDLTWVLMHRWVK